MSAPAKKANPRYTAALEEQNEHLTEQVKNLQTSMVEMGQVADGFQNERNQARDQLKGEQEANAELVRRVRELEGQLQRTHEELTEARNGGEGGISRQRAEALQERLNLARALIAAQRELTMATGCFDRAVQYTGETL